jgi:hypothetical protein
MKLLRWKVVFGTLLILLSSCDNGAKSYCEVIEYRDRRIVLSIPAEYYVRSRSSSSTISLEVRYADLAAPSKRQDSYDPAELRAPNWQPNSSNYAALVQIYRIGMKSPSTPSELKASNLNMIDVPSDWDGWAKFKACPSGCQRVFYTSDTWRERGVSHVLCYVVEGRDPAMLACGASDRIEGVILDFYFPALKKEHFSYFRAKIDEFILSAMAQGEKNCGKGEM